MAETSDKPTYHIDAVAENEHNQLGYATDLYAAAAVAEPLVGLDAIDDEQVARYHEQGYLAVADAFDPQQVAGAIDDLTRAIVDPPEGFRGVHYESIDPDRLHEIPAAQRLDLVRKLFRFAGYVPKLTALSEDARLLSVVRTLLGDREPKMFQDMALLKPPHGREKPWHQDHAYFPLALGEPVVGVWIALDDATPENGCMHVIPGSHRAGPVVHFARRDWQLCDADVDKPHIVAAPLKAGGLLFFSGLLHHGTPTNQSDLRRRAAQFHYCPADAEWVDEQARLAVFGSEGKNVEC